MKTTFAPTQLELTPYVWGLHINSDDNVGPMPLNADLGLGKLLRSLKGLAELEITVKEKRFFVLADGILRESRTEAAGLHSFARSR